MASMPCKNSSCGSFGKSHPNCKCYVGMAEGGDAQAFCSEERMHNPECEYFKQPSDPNHDAAGFMMRHGIHGILNQTLMDDVPRYQSSAQSGHKKLSSHISDLFANRKLPKTDLSLAKKSLENWMQKGGIIHDIQQALHEQHQGIENFAKGGEVKKSGIHDHAISTAHPAQNILLQAAKGRISDYLSSQKPQENIPKLAFDDNPDQTQQKKTYENVKDIALHPLGILHHVQDGTISPLHVKHFNSMYPELAEPIQKRLTEEITKFQMEGKKPPRDVRQGLSLLLGTPLSGEFKPQNIIAAQSVFAPAAVQTNTSNPSQPTKKSKGQPKGSKSALSKSDQAFLTGSQARAEREQVQR